MRGAPAAPAAAFLVVALYLPGPAAPDPAPASAQDPPLGRSAAFGALEPEPRALVPAGTALRSRPDPEAEALAIFDTDTEVPILERRGRWIRTFHLDAAGWLAPDGEPTIDQFQREALEAGYLVLDTSPEEKAARIESARAQLEGENPDIRTLGGWPLYTDVVDSRELARLDAVARRLREIYEARYGLRPGGDPSRVVVLYRNEEAYRRFTAEFTDIGELHGDGHADDAMAVLYVADRLAVDVAAILVHELTHLLNRSVFLVPPGTWIEEGLANDLGFSRIDSRGGIDPGTLGVRNTRTTTSGGQFIWTQLLSDWRENRGRLLPVSEILDLVWAEFVNDRYRQSNYAQSAFFIRYLLDESPPRTRDAFREFLASASRGGPSGSDALASALGLSAADLRSGYESWLTRRAAAGR